MATNKAVGIIIKMQDYQDYDKVITILSSDTLLSFIALGVRKINSKNRVALQLGNIVEIEYFRARLTNKLSKLKTAHLIKQPPLKTADTALVLLELIRHLQKMRSGSSRTFNAIVEAYEYFGEEYNHFVKTYIIFHLLDELGVRPNMQACVECNRKDRIQDFSLHSGGFICALHTEDALSLQELESWSALGKGIATFIQTSPKANKDIYHKLITFIDENRY